MSLQCSYSGQRTGFQIVPQIAGLDMILFAPSEMIVRRAFNQAGPKESSFIGTAQRAAKPNLLAGRQQRLVVGGVKLGIAAAATYAGSQLA